MKVKIQSESDIITNSSSEAFMIVDQDSITRIKQAAGHLIGIMGIDETVNNVLEITPDYSEFKDAIEHMILTGAYDPYMDGENEIEDGGCVNGYPVCKDKSEITPEIFEKAVYDFMDFSCGDYPLIHGVDIKPKKPEYQKIADAISDLIYSVSYEPFYC